MVRNNAVDNARFAMILLVVFGHLIEPILNTSAIIKTIYMSVYSYHMPVFVLLSGMMTKVEPSKARTKKLMGSTLIPFLVFTVLYEAFALLTSGHVSQYTVNFRPYWLLWFLYSLFIWRLLLPVVMRLRHPIATSLIISLAAGYADKVGYFLGISRTLYFLPFFLVGHILMSGILSSERISKLPNLGYMGILALNPILFWLLNDLPHQWLYGSVSYQRLGCETLSAAAIRLGWYCVSMATSIAILMLIPNRKLKISEYGSNSLYAYVWHGFVVKSFIDLGIVDFVGGMGAPVAVPFLFCAALLLTLALSTNAVAEYTESFLLAPARTIVLGKR